MDAAVITALDSGHFDIRFLLEIRFDSGTSYYTTETNGTTFDGQDYTYLPAIGALGTIQESGELDPTDYQVVLGGVEPTILAKFLSEPLINRRCVVVSVIYKDGELIGEMSRIEGIMQPPSITHGASCTVTIPVKDALADWDRNIQQLYTDEAQRRLNPADNCLEHVSELAGREIIWPAASYWD